MSELHEEGGEFARRIEKWASTLDSGEYEQVRGYMRQYGQYCAWGVACEIYRQDTGKGAWVNFSRHKETFRAEGVMTIGGPPESVRAYYGLSEQEARQVIEWNDGKTKVLDSFIGGGKVILGRYIQTPGLSFPEIAVKIKEELL